MSSMTSPLSPTLSHRLRGERGKTNFVDLPKFGFIGGYAKISTVYDIPSSDSFGLAQ
jgi:hypothetical protein